MPKNQKKKKKIAYSKDLKTESKACETYKITVHMIVAEPCV